MICLRGSGVEAIQARRLKTQVAPSHTSVRAQLIGCWRVLWSGSRRATGQVEVDQSIDAPLAELMYDHLGHVAAQLSRRDQTN